MKNKKSKSKIKSKLAKKIGIVFLAMLMSMSSAQTVALANSIESQNQTFEYTCVNPIYQSDLSDKELEAIFDEELYASQTTNVTFNQDEESYPTIMDAAISVRDNMIARNEAIYIEFESRSLDFTGLIAEIFEMAVSEDLANSTVAGDYLAWQYGGYTCSGGRMATDNNTYVYFVNLKVSYYTTAKEEKAVTDAVTDVLNDLDIYDFSQYDKIKVVYDYVCDVCDYDHSGNNNNYKKFSAYGAIKQKTAVCQGYSVLLHRMLKELGIETRIIAGNNHSWNIVKIGNAYYNVDATWDDNYYSNGLPYKYFLNCADHFSNHTRLAKYNTKAFNNNYVMTNKCYYDIYPELADTFKARSNNPTKIEDLCKSHSGKELKKNVPATCTSAGYKIYVCNECGNETKTTVAATGHKAVKDKAVAATYAKAGKTEGSHCSACKKVLVAQKAVPKLTVKATKLNSVTVKAKSITVKWAKQTAATGYQIQYSTDKNFKKNNKTVTVTKNSTTSKTISKLNAKKKYYVRVRCYKTENGKKYYSTWSAVKNVTTKK